MNHIINNPYIATSVTFTGHRPAKLAQNNRQAYQSKHYDKFLPALTKSLEAYLNIGIDTFITGGAQGFDQLVFWAVENLKTNFPDKTIRNVVYIPFKGQESKWIDDGGIFSPTKYRQMLDLADEVHYCTDLDNTANRRDIAMALDYRNRCMCKSASRLLALWNEDEYKADAIAPGGTANCWKFAKSLRMKCDKIVYFIDKDGYLDIVYSVDNNGRLNF